MAVKPQIRGFIRAAWTSTRRDAAGAAWSMAPHDGVWLLGCLCALHRQPFHADLLRTQCPAPHDRRTLDGAARAVGLDIVERRAGTGGLRALPVPFVALLHADAQPGSGQERSSRPVVITQVHEDQVVGFQPHSHEPHRWPRQAFDAAHAGVVLCVRPRTRHANDPDDTRHRPRFGFGWFWPVLRRHHRVWRNVLLASLVIQLLALGTPLFTQVIIDKVVVHRAHSTLIAIAAGMAIFLVFSQLLGWTRQYLLARAGHHMDAVLSDAVFAHLLKLPLRYFEQRPTGVITARLQGVDTIREFIASAAVGLVLDLPFLLVFVAIMFWYSPTLTWIALAMLALIAGASAAAAPLFQQRLNRQFQRGARGQAFLTEHIGAAETVKCLQMEPRLQARHAALVQDHLAAVFHTRVLSASLQTATSTLEQLLTLLVLVVGAHTVMTQPDFTIGMLVAFQMFAGRLSQPVMRLVGLWQQFQQARLCVQRLGDVMDAPPEPYSAVPRRLADGRGRIDIEGLAFRHSPQHPWLYRGLSLRIEPGQTVLVVGPSGSGKSTLARLLLGFHQPGEGRIRIDGIDIASLSANELRQHFGVVPQETVLFAGSILDNLCAASPDAPLERVVQAAQWAGVHDTIEQLPQGYHTLIGERGSGLSGGQRQRLAIARALLKRPRVLIFDEATSALDDDTAARFAATVNQLRGIATMLFITHAMPRGLQVDAVVQIGGSHPGATAHTP